MCVSTRAYSAHGEYLHLFVFVYVRLCVLLIELLSHNLLSSSAIMLHPQPHLLFPKSSTVLDIAHNAVQVKVGTINHPLSFFFSVLLPYSLLPPSFIARPVYVCTQSQHMDLKLHCA